MRSDDTSATGVTEYRSWMPPTTRDRPQRRSRTVLVSVEGQLASLVAFGDP